MGKAIGDLAPGVNSWAVELEDLEAGDGEQQEYWLLAVRAARKAKALTEGNAAVDTQTD